MTRDVDIDLMAKIDKAIEEADRTKKDAAKRARRLRSLKRGSGDIAELVSSVLDERTRWADSGEEGHPKE